VEDLCFDRRILKQQKVGRDFSGNLR